MGCLRCSGGTSVCISGSNLDSIYQYSAQFAFNASVQDLDFLLNQVILYYIFMKSGHFL